MPKGKGAAGAWESDEASVKELVEKTIREEKTESVRINIVLPKSILFVADQRVLDRKQKGENLNRSSYIAQLIEADMK